MTRLVKLVKIAKKFICYIWCSSFYVFGALVWTRGPSHEKRLQEAIFHVGQSALIIERIFSMKFNGQCRILSMKKLFCVLFASKFFIFLFLLDSKYNENASQSHAILTIKEVKFRNMIKKNLYVRYQCSFMLM